MGELPVIVDFILSRIQVADFSPHHHHHSPLFFFSICSIFKVAAFTFYFSLGKRKNPLMNRFLFKYDAWVGWRSEELAEGRDAAHLHVSSRISQHIIWAGECCSSAPVATKGRQALVLLHEHHLVILAFLKLSWDGWTVRSEAAHICTLINRKWSCNRYVHVVLIPKYMIRYHLVSFVNTQLQFVIYCALFKVMHPCMKAADATYQRCRQATEQILQTSSGSMRRLTRTYECMTLQPAAG